MSRPVSAARRCRLDVFFDVQVEWFHAQPRWNSEFKPAPKVIPGNMFDPTTQDAQTRNYIEGLSMQAGIFVALGVVFTVGLVLMYVLAWRLGWYSTWCVRTKESTAQSDPWGAPETPTKACVTRGCIAVWVFATLTMAGVLAASGGVAELDYSLTDSLGSLGSLQRVLTSGSEKMELTETAANATWEAGLATVAAIDALNVSSAAGNVSAALEAARNGSVLVSSLAQSAVSKTGDNEDAMTSLASSLGDAQSSVTSTRLQQRGTASGLLAAIALIVALFAVSSVRLWSACVGCFKATVSCALVMHVLVWVFAALQLATILLASDFCASPDASALNIISAITASGSSNLTSSSARFYLQDCATNDPSAEGLVPITDAGGIYGATSGAALQLQAAATAAAYVAGNVSDLGPELRPFYPNGYDAVLWAAGNASAAAAAANASAWAALASVDCRDVRPPWESLLRGVCGRAFALGFLPLFVGAVLGSVFGLALLCAGLPICGQETRVLLDKEERESIRSAADRAPSYDVISTHNPLESATSIEISNVTTPLASRAAGASHGPARVR